MKVIHDYPPNIDRIREAFKINDNTTLFSHGDTLYVPSTLPVPDHLMAHEELHGERQLKMGVDEWWEKYLTDEKFRLQEEVLAYRAQYKVLMGYPREYRRKVLAQIAKSLGGPMYGNMVDRNTAKDLITGKLP